MKRNWILLLAATLVFAIIGAYKVQATEDKGKCTNASLNGSYGLGATGTIIGVGPFAAVGVLTFDGKGNLAGSLTEKINGNTFQNDTFRGNYIVDSFCRVSDVWHFTSGDTSQHDSVIVSNGNEFSIVNTSPGNVISGTAKRMFPEGS